MTPTAKFGSTPNTVVVDVRVNLYEDNSTNPATFHYQVVIAGAKHARKRETACGRSVENMRSAAWFKPGDRRGRVHYDRACHYCREALRV